MIIVSPFILILIFFPSRIEFWGSLSTKASVGTTYTLFTVSLSHFDPITPLCLLQVLLAFKLFDQNPLTLVCGILGLDNPNTEFYSIFSLSLVQTQILVIILSVNTVFKEKWHNCPLLLLIHVLLFLLQIVYSDVWGPAPITSINGFCYYVSFIHAYSHFTWFFPLKQKSQVLSSFLHFKNTMENLLETSIKFFAPIVVVNIPRMILNLFVLPMVYFINSLALIHHNRMVFPRENIVTLLIWHYLSFLILSYPSHIDHMLLLPRFFLLIVFHPLYGIMSLRSEEHTSELQSP